MLNRVFFYVSLEEINEYRSTFPSHKYVYIPGTLGIHQVATSPGNSRSIQYRNTSCACTPCLRGDYRKCECLDQFKNYLKPITMTTHTFSISKKKQKDMVDDEDELIDLDEVNEWEDIYIETEASKFIEEGDFAVIKTGDDHAYYLLKLTPSPYETKCEVTDDNKHSFPPFHCVVKGNYLEKFKRIHDGHLYYLNTK